MIKAFNAVLQREIKEQKMIVLLAFVTGRRRAIADDTTSERKR